MIKHYKYFLGWNIAETTKFISHVCHELGLTKTISYCSDLNNPLKIGVTSKKV